MAQGNGTCVSSQDVAKAELGPLPEGKRHTKNSQSIQSRACSAPPGEQKRRWEPAPCHAVRRSHSPWTVCCPLPGAGSPTSRHHACAESILHQHSGLRASGPTHLLSAVPLSGSLAVPLCFVHPPQKTAFGRFCSSLCFTLAFIVVSFTLPTVIHSRCFRIILLGIVLLTWGPWFPGCVTQSVVLHCLHPGHPHHPVGPVMWVSPSPARG